MRREIARQFVRRFFNTWWLRAREVVFWRKHHKKWHVGYAESSPTVAAIFFELVIRLAELAGFGLSYQLIDLVVSGGRYRALSHAQQAFAKTYFTEAILRAAYLDAGASVTAGRLNIAFVSGTVIKSNTVLSLPVLCHELVHVEQFHRWGWAYVAKNLTAQAQGKPYQYQFKNQLRVANLPYRLADNLHSAEQAAARVEDHARARLQQPPRYAVG